MHITYTYIHISYAFCWLIQSCDTSIRIPGCLQLMPQVSNNFNLSHIIYFIIKIININSYYWKQLKICLKPPWTSGSHAVECWIRIKATESNWKKIKIGYFSVVGFAVIVNVCNVAFAVSHTEITMTLVVPRKFEPKKFSGAPFGIQTVRWLIFTVLWLARLHGMLAAWVHYLVRAGMVHLV